MAKADGHIEARLGPLPAVPELATVWTALERRADPPLFLTWTWIGAWIKQCPPHQLSLFTARRNGSVVGLALVGLRSVAVGPLGLTRLALNQSGTSDLDRVYIEFNDVLAERADAAAVRSALMTAISSALPKSGWTSRSEFTWAASPLDRDAMPAPDGLTVERARISPSPFANLDRVREAGGDPLPLLSANTRQQIRRAMRLYETEGPLQIRPAGSLKTAEDWLRRLQDLHQARWARKATGGAFTNPFFAGFIEEVLKEGLPSGAVDILKISGGDLEVGYLINFVYRDTVANYLSGLRFGPDSRYKPGLVSHALAIRYYAAEDAALQKYSFLAGRSRYKSSLSTGEDILHWYTYRPKGALAPLDRMLFRTWQRSTWA